MKIKPAIIALGFVCLVSFSLMMYAARGDAAITDESAHIPAGYGYARYLDYRLNPEHPPLLKALSGVALLLLQPRFDTTDSLWTREINAQWDAGRKFLYEWGNDPAAILAYARFPAMLLTIFTIILIYYFSKRILGAAWALLPAFLFALSPTILAHGHYVTTDISAAFGILIGTFAFLRHLRKSSEVSQHSDAAHKSGEKITPATRALIIAGLAFGVAQLCKFSAFLLIPFFVLMLAVWLIIEALKNYNALLFSWKEFVLRAIQSYLKLAVLFAIGFIVVVYPVYFLFTRNYPLDRQLSDTTAILTSFGGGPTAPGQFCKISRCPADLVIALTKNEITRPFAQYLLGVDMVLQRAGGGNTNYFMGRVSAAGNHWYFPLIFLMKESLPALILLFIAAGYGFISLFRFWKNNVGSRIRSLLSGVSWNFPLITLAAFVAVYWANSIASPLNIGFRHLIPTLPFIYILVAVGVRGWFTSLNAKSPTTAMQFFGYWLKALAHAGIKAFVLAILLGWVAAEALLAAPYFLSYYNEAAGGLAGGYKYATDSNYDWGQDLLRLQTWVSEKNKQCALIETSAPCGVKKIAVDYFGGGNPKYYLGDAEVDWWSSRGNPADADIHYFAISVNSLQGALQPTAENFERKPEDSYPWLRDAKWSFLHLPHPGEVPPPDWRVGTSIFVYKL